MKKDYPGINSDTDENSSGSDMDKELNRQQALQQGEEPEDLEECETLPTLEEIRMRRRARRTARARERDYEEKRAVLTPRRVTLRDPEQVAKAAQAEAEFQLKMNKQCAEGRTRFSSIWNKTTAFTTGVASIFPTPTEPQVQVPMPSQRLRLIGHRCMQSSAQFWSLVSVLAL